MQAYLTLTRRELGSFFYSWIGYVVIAGAVFLTGLSFVILLRQLQGEPTALPITEVFLSLCYWLIVLFSAPIITMRLFALEKYSGTFETLMTAPVGDVAVVLAKFTAAIIFYMIMWLPLLACILVLRYFSRGSNLLDPGTLASTFLGIFLVGILYMAIGCFASSLTRSQIVAAMVSFAIGLAFFLASYLSDRFALQQTWQMEALNSICIVEQMKEFARGVVDTRYIVFYVTSSGFFLFLAYRVIESRRWK
ncbi:MAG TPA: ABC transporter permease [Candidatus Saccharimonadales bacterium]|jgi:ABC-2 type transport system permease protein|nr:ABC transporter permease [Candidatus Saccharimonadales bacterium]